MTEPEIDKLFDGFRQQRILVLGDVMVDSYMFGKVERISPEAPIPIVRITNKENRLGGAANVALNLRALGAKPLLFSVIGNDPMGEEFLKLMEASGLSTEGIQRVNDRPTTVKTRVISANQHLLRVDEESLAPLQHSEEQLLLDSVCAQIGGGKLRAVLFQDYNKGVLSPQGIERVISESKRMGIISLADPKKENFYAFRGISLFKPNFREFAEGTHIELSKTDQTALREASLAFLSEMDLKYLMVTLSEAGIIIASKDSFHHFPAHIRDIADVSGAGDTVISVASLCLASGASPAIVAALSNLAGGLVCEKPGVVPIEKDLLIQESKEFFGKNPGIS